MIGSNEWFREEMLKIGISLKDKEWDSLWYMPPEDKKHMIIRNTAMTPFMLYYHRRIPELLKDNYLLISKAYVITLIWGYDGKKDDLMNIDITLKYDASRFMKHYMSLM